MGGLTTAMRGHTTTTAARQAFLSRFDDQVDPQRVLAPAERARRADAARRLHMSRLSLKSSLTRSKKKAVAAGEMPATASEIRRARVEPTAA